MSAMKNYTIKITNRFGKFVVCEWEAETAEQAVKEFLEMNPMYASRGLIIAE